MARKAKTYTPQIAAMPLKRTAKGKLRVLLVTSRETHRWVLPKGWPMDGKKPWTAAKIEAMEEAGVGGDIERDPIGHYSYRKRMPAGKRLSCRVAVYPLVVSREKDRWKEMRQRRRRWVSLKKAARLVQEKELSALLAGIAKDGPTSNIRAKLFP